MMFNKKQANFINYLNISFVLATVLLFFSCDSKLGNENQLEKYAKVSVSINNAARLIDIPQFESVYEDYDYNITYESEDLGIKPTTLGCDSLTKFKNISFDLQFGTYNFTLTVEKKGEAEKTETRQVENSEVVSAPSQNITNETTDTTDTSDTPIEYADEKQIFKAFIFDYKVDDAEEHLLFNLMPCTEYGNNGELEYKVIIPSLKTGKYLLQAYLEEQTDNGGLSVCEWNITPEEFTGDDSSMSYTLTGSGFSYNSTYNLIILIITYNGDDASEALLTETYDTTTYTEVGIKFLPDIKTTGQFYFPEINEFYTINFSSDYVYKNADRLPKFYSPYESIILPEIIDDNYEVTGWRADYIDNDGLEQQWIFEDPTYFVENNEYKYVFNDDYWWQWDVTLTPITKKIVQYDKSNLKFYIGTSEDLIQIYPDENDVIYIEKSGELAELDFLNAYIYYTFEIDSEIEHSPNWHNDTSYAAFEYYDYMDDQMKTGTYLVNAELINGQQFWKFAPITANSLDNPIVVNFYNGDISEFLLTFQINDLKGNVKPSGVMEYTFIMKSKTGDFNVEFDETSKDSYYKGELLIDGSEANASLEISGSENHYVQVSLPISWQDNNLEQPVIVIKVNDEEIEIDQQNDVTVYGEGSTNNYVFTISSLNFAKYVGNNYIEVTLTQNGKKIGYFDGRFICYK